MVFRFVPANEMEEAIGDMAVPQAGMMHYMSSLAMPDWAQLVLAPSVLVPREEVWSRSINQPTLAMKSMEEIDLSYFKSLKYIVFLFLLL